MAALACLVGIAFQLCQPLSIRAKERGQEEKAPAAQTPPAPKRMPVPETEILDFSIKNSGVEKLENIELMVRMPKGLPKEESPAGILAMPAYSNEAKDVLRRLSMPASSNKMYQFADRYKLIVVSWTTAGLYDNGASFTKSAKEIQRNNDDFGATLKTWDRQMEVICNRLKMPYRDVLICGVSRGAHWAHRYALRMPEKFLAVHAHVNSSYEEPGKNGSSVLWLITTGNQDYGYEDSKIFYRKCRELGYPILYKSQGNLGHGMSDKIQELGLLFFEYAWKMKLARDEVKKQEDADKMSARSVPRVGFPQAMLKPFFEPPYVGDLLNQEVYPVANQNEIPDALRVPIPTRELALAWGFFNE